MAFKTTIMNKTKRNTYNFKLIHIGIHIGLVIHKVYIHKEINS